MQTIKTNDPRAIYIFCDGSMMRDTESSGGTGYIIKFPDFLKLPDVSDYFGIYIKSNIERIELQALISAIEGMCNYLKNNDICISPVSKIVFCTDRFYLQDNERTNPYKIRVWRTNNGKNHEGKEIKNWDLIHKLDKVRSKLNRQTGKSIRIEYRRRNKNKEADKLSKFGRKNGVKTDKIAIIGHKIIKRIFDGGEIKYKLLKPKQRITIRVFRKRPIKNQWEINVEICSGQMKGQKFVIIVDQELEEKLKRGNFYQIRIKSVYNHHIEIYRTLKKINKATAIPKIVDHNEFK